ncbi:MAG: hypothetical protein K2X48_00360 [Chitinophagaceae bacterium]|nr:hypothetical protein [Chitinophagaceae bacterium]
MKAEIIKLWTCPTCGRQFERKGQSHSCKPYELKLHFEGKPKEKLLYQKLKDAIKKQIGPFKAESLECCIHFVSTFTFAAVKIMKDKIRVDFSLGRKIKSKKIVKEMQLSVNRFLYCVDIHDEHEIDRELLEFLQEAIELKDKADTHF